MGFLERLLFKKNNPPPVIHSAWQLVHRALQERELLESKLGFSHNEITIRHLPSADYADVCIALLSAPVSVGSMKKGTTEENIQPPALTAKGFENQNGALSVRITFDNFLPETKLMSALLRTTFDAMLPAPRHAKRTQTNFGELIAIWQPAPLAIVETMTALLNHIAALHNLDETFAPSVYSLEKREGLILSPPDLYEKFYKAECLPFVTNQKPVNSKNLGG